MYPKVPQAPSYYISNLAYWAVPLLALGGSARLQMTGGHAYSADEFLATA
jgi:hypothetical protein